MKNCYVVIGVGGTGGILSQKLSRFINANDTLLLIDGDKIEMKNLIRQPYFKNELNEFKSTVMSTKINSYTKFSNCFSVEQYISSSKSLILFIQKIMDEYVDKLFIISTVDNHKTRLFIEGSIEEIKLMLINKFKNAELNYIDSANEDFNGDIFVNIFRSSKYINIKEETEEELILTPESCEELISNGNIQQFTTNDFAANLILKSISNILNSPVQEAKRICFDEWNLKIESHELWNIKI